MEKSLSNRIEELACKAEDRGTFTYTDFLNPSEQSEIAGLKLYVKVDSWGGADFCERKIMRFGDFCYDEPYPFKIIFISPTGQKFCRQLTHRDYLGSILGLGIDRSKVGDIILDGKCAYVVVMDTVFEFVEKNLTKVSNCVVECREVKKIPQELAPKRVEVKFPVSSPRIDAILCRLYNLSREDGAELVRAGRVLINGREEATPSTTPKQGDVVAVKGYGKFLYLGESGTSPKGKTYIKIEKYV